MHTRVLARGTPVAIIMAGTRTHAARRPIELVQSPPRRPRTSRGRMGDACARTGRRRNEAREGKGKGGRIVYRGSAKARSGHAEPEPEPARRRCGAGLARRRSVGRSGGGEEDKTLRKTRCRAHVAAHGRPAARSPARASDIAAARQDGRSPSLDRLLGRQMTQHRLACAVREGEPGQPAYASASAPGKRHSMLDSASGATPGKVQAQAGTRAGRRLLQLSRGPRRQW